MRDDIHRLPGTHDGVPLITPAGIAERAEAPPLGTRIGDRGRARSAMQIMHQVTARRPTARTATDGTEDRSQAPGRGRKAARGAFILITALAVLAMGGAGLYAATHQLGGPWGHLIHLPDAGHTLPLAAAVAAVIVILAGGAYAVRVLIRAASGTPVEDLLTVVVAALVTIVSMNGMWRFFGNVLQFGPALRVIVFWVLEGATITFALRARRTMRDRIAKAIAAEEGSASRLGAGSTGIDGMLMWVSTGVSAVLASMDAGSIPAAIARLVMPLMAALLWERGLRLERQRTAGRTINWRVTPERVLVAIGLAEPAALTAGEVDVERCLNRVVRARHAYRALVEAEAAQWRLDRAAGKLQRRLLEADERTGLASDAGLQEKLFAKCGLQDGARALAGVRPPAPWTGHPWAIPNDQDVPGKGHRRRRRRRARPQGDGHQGNDHAQLAEAVTEARKGGDYSTVDALLCDRDDHADFTQWLASHGYPKSLLALVSLYACGVGARVEAQRWIAQLVPGPGGQVDKSAIRQEAAKVTPHWSGGREDNGITQEKTEIA
jgi:hypothetical protein